MTILRYCSIIIGFALSGLLFAASQSPGEHTRSGQNFYQTQEAHDAVQDERLKNIEGRDIINNAKLDDVTDKQNYTLGGLAVLGALFTANAIVVHRKKS